MTLPPRAAAGFLVAVLSATKLLAQTTPDQPPTVGTASPDNPPAANTASIPSPAGTLGVAAVKLDSGWRASKLIGASVYNEHDEKIGSVDDLIMTPSDKVVVAVIQVGGFLGVGGKLVAVPYNRVRMGNGHVSIAGASKEALGALPAFTYGDG